MYAVSGRTRHAVLAAAVAMSVVACAPSTATTGYLSGSSPAVVDVGTSLSARVQSTGDRIVAAGLAQLGTPVAWGGGTPMGPSHGAGPDKGVVGFDASGLTLYAVAQATGIVLPHFTGNRWSPGQLYDPRAAVVTVADRRPGDLLFLGADGNSHHVGIVYTHDSVITAPGSGQTVRIEPLSDWSGEDWYVRRFH